MKDQMTKRAKSGVITHACDEARRYNYQRRAGVLLILAAFRDTNLFTLLYWYGILSIVSAIRWVEITNIGL
jgi:hypothetical protein